MMEEKELYHKALELWGINAQVNMVIEELLELTLEVVRTYRDRTTKTKIISEIADVEVVLGQLRFILDIPEHKVLIEKSVKLKRLENLINEWEKSK